MQTKILRKFREEENQNQAIDSSKRISTRITVEVVVESESCHNHRHRPSQHVSIKTKPIETSKYD
jgi:hypothetical protein